jgi:hypothetical protein
MPRRYAYLITASSLVLGLAGCSDTAKVPVEAGYGPDPVLRLPTSR